VLETTDRMLRGIDRPVPVMSLSYRRAAEADGAGRDPVCELPLTTDTAEASDVDGLGRAVLFCSASCHDTWRNRPVAAADDPGSPRRPLIGT
jgi:hypothetical protein